MPAEYGVTGITTFIVNHLGKVYERDLGDDTAVLSAAIQDYNLDGTWKIAKE